MSLLADRKTAQSSEEWRRLWDDQRVWFVNCVAIEATWPAVPLAERAAARRGCDQILAALAAAW
jgi:hypothetical protein